MITALVPGDAPLDDDELLELYGLEARGTSGTSAPGWLRVNFVASIDGSATADGLSGSLGGEADHRVFDLLRRLADVVLVASGTVRDEGYGAMRLGPSDVAWRVEHGLAPQPVFAIVSGSLNLDPESSIFTEAPVRPIVLTVSSAPASRRDPLSAVADVLDCGDDTVDAGVVRSLLVARGLGRIHCEGGPSFLGTLIAADVVDELCLTISPQLVAGSGPRIAHGAESLPRDMTLAHVLRSDDVLLTRWLRRRST